MSIATFRSITFIDDFCMRGGGKFIGLLQGRVGMGEGSEKAYLIHGSDSVHEEGE